MHPVTRDAQRGSFDEVVVPHLDAAYRLARWLTSNSDDARDAVQEASLRAFQYYRTFTGGNGRAWFLHIVRNTCRAMRGRTIRGVTEPFEEDRHSRDMVVEDPEALLLRTDRTAFVERALSRLPDRHRRLLIGREWKGLSYRELAAELDVPIGTVMSGLARARHAFRGALVDQSAPTRWDDDI